MHSHAHKIFRQLLCIVLAALLSFVANAEEVSREQIKGLDEQVQDIKKDVLNLSSELAMLEEKLLFPSNTQVSLFVSMHKGDDFRLDSVQLKLNEKVVASICIHFVNWKRCRVGAYNGFTWVILKPVNTSLLSATPARRLQVESTSAAAVTA